MKILKVFILIDMIKAFYLELYIIEDNLLFIVILCISYKLKDTFAFVEKYF